MSTFVALILTFVASASAASITGIVADARTGEPLSGATVDILTSRQSVRTGSDGTFTLPDTGGGELRIRVTMPNYAPVNQTIPAGAAPVEIRVLLPEDASSPRAAVTVVASPFEDVEPVTAVEHTLNKTEIQAMGTNVFADPLRSVQAMPGITVADDKRGEISIRGAGFSQVGIQMDGVLLEGFLHQLSGDDLSNGRDRATVSVLSTDRIASVSVLTGPMPASQGLATAGMVNLFTRDGSRDRTHFRLSTGIQLGTSFVLDGPIGRRASYLIGGRGSALEYIGRATSDEVRAKGGVLFEDGQAKLVVDASVRHRLSMSLVGGRFRADDPKRDPLFGRNTVSKGDSFNGAAIATWDWTVSPKLFARTRLFRLRTNLRARNLESILLARFPASQYGGRQDWSFNAGRHRAEFGVYVRSMHGEQSVNAFLGPQIQPTPVDFFRGDTTQKSYYAQDTIAITEGVHLTLGGRAESDRLTSRTHFLPRASFSWRLGAAGTFRAGFAQHGQFPAFSDLLGRFGNRTLTAPRATHYSASLEHPFGERARLLLEVFRREDRNQIWTLSEPRVVAGRVREDPALPLNSASGTADGFEVMLQRRSGNRFSGWMSYGYLRTRYRESVSGLRFPSDLDQRHSLNAFAVYRLSGSWTLNSVWRRGSGQPYAGFIRRAPDGFFLDSERNALRLRAYDRWDLRVSKTMRWKRALITLSAEALNVLNHGNLDFYGVERYDSRTGRILNEPAVGGLSRFYGLTLVLQF